MPNKHNEPRRHKIPKARYRVENWREYDVALRDRGSLTVWVTPEAIAAWHPARIGRPGRSAHYSDLAIETGVMLRLAFARPWRPTEGLLRSVTTLLGSEPRCPRPYDAVAPQRRVVLGHRPGRAGWSGHRGDRQHRLEGFRRGEWQMAKHGGRDRQTWRKLHLAIDPDTGEILASALTTTEEGDASLVRLLLDQIAAPIAAVLADGAAAPRSQVVHQRPIAAIRARSGPKRAALSQSGRPSRESTAARCARRPLRSRPRPGRMR